MKRSLFRSGARCVPVSPLLAIVLSLSMAAPVAAERHLVPAAEWDTGTRLTLAQIMVGEADWNEPDHVAIAFVLARRWQLYQRAHGPIAFQRYMQLYSSTMKVETTRARWVRALAWGPLPGRHGKTWSRVQQLVDVWGEGKLRDPCPTAEHWGGAMDRPSRKWEPVHCGLTKNIFYQSRDKRLARR